MIFDVKAFVTDNLDKFAPINPQNRTRADEIDPQRMLDPHSAPLEYCETCGRVIRQTPQGDGDAFLFWVPVPCDTPECTKAREERERREKERDEREKKARLLRDSQASLQDSIGGSGFYPGEEQDYAFDLYQPQTSRQKMALLVCRQFVDSFPEHVSTSEKRGDGMGLFIHGDNGRGKTHLAKAIGLALTDMLYGGIVYRMDSGILHDIRATYGRSDVSERSCIDVFGSCNLLIVDDFGKTRATDWAMETLFDIIDLRYQTRRPTILTSNFAPDELESMLGEGSQSNRDRAAAIMDRVYERFTTVELTGENWRRRGA